MACGAGGVVAAVAVALALASPAVAGTSPTTRDLMVTTAMCGLEIDDTLARSIKTLYERALSSGGAFVSVEPRLKRLMEDADPDLPDEVADQDLTCASKFLSLNG
jgi:hypothetical protein